MNKPILAGCIALAATAAAAGALAAGSGLKPGLWEIKTIKQIVDGRDMMGQMAAAQAQMQQAYANMPAAQRKQMEAMMAQRGAAMPGASSGTRICVSAEMAAREQPVVDPEHRCEPAKVSRAGNRTTFEFNCASEGRTMVGKGENTVSGDVIGTKLDMVMSDAQGRHTMQSESQMKYLGADCGAIKPIDQAAKEAQAASRRK